jgi:hypothetical protein
MTVTTRYNVGDKLKVEEDGSPVIVESVFITQTAQETLIEYTVRNLETGGKHDLEQGELTL